MSRNVFFFFNAAFILKAGAKVSIFLFLASFFENIFKLIFLPLCYPKSSKELPLAGCKYKN
jgi:hypothetical protein